MTPDPGWAGIFGFLRPGGKSGFGNRLVLFRALYLGFMLTLAILGLAVTVITAEATPDDDRTGPVVTVLVATALATLPAARIVRRKQLANLTADRLVDQLPALMFVQIGLGEAIPMVGFVSSFMVSSATPYWLGLALALPQLAMAAPTARSIERIGDEHLPGIDVVGALEIKGDPATP